jgi:hypothetical protein
MVEYTNVSLAHSTRGRPSPRAIVATFEEAQRSNTIKCPVCFQLRASENGCKALNNTVEHNSSSSHTEQAQLYDLSNQ